MPAYPPLCKNPQRKSIRTIGQFSYFTLTKAIQMSMRLYFIFIFLFMPFERVCQKEWISSHERYAKYQLAHDGSSWLVLEWREKTQQ